MGCGDKVHIGIAPIPGVEKYFVLSPSLVNYLHDYGFLTLDQIYVENFANGSGVHWLLKEELELGGVWKK